MEPTLDQTPLLKNTNLNRPISTPLAPAKEGPNNPFKGGVLSEAMWARSHSNFSRYQDKFDYGIFDKLHARFEGKQPRGGVVYKGSLKLLESEDCRKCFHRFEIDTYGRGCTHNCAYCYAKAYLHQRKYWNEPMPFPIDISELRKTFSTVFETDKSHKFRDVLQRRVPLRIGSMSDSFMWLDKKYKVTQELLKILKYYQYPYIIFTRSDLVADDEYIPLLDKRLASIQMSICSINESLTRTIEPGAPSPFRRLNALKRLAEEGFWTTVRINPLLPMYPDGYFTNPNFDHSKPVNPFPFFSWDMIKVIAEHKVPSVLTGIVRLYQHNIRFMSSALGYDFRSHFGEETKLERAALHFSEAETRYYYEKIRSLCVENGVRFSTCYIGNDSRGESFEKYRPLWSNSRDCCDALGNVPAFKATCADITPSMPLPGLTRELPPLRPQALSLSESST